MPASELDELVQSAEVSKVGRAHSPVVAGLVASSVWLQVIDQAIKAAIQLQNEARTALASVPEKSN